MKNPKNENYQNQRSKRQKSHKTRKNTIIKTTRTFLRASALILTLLFVSCSSNNDDASQELIAFNDSLTNKVLILEGNLTDLKAQLTAANVAKEEAILKQQELNANAEELENNIKNLDSIIFNLTLNINTLDIEVSDLKQKIAILNKKIELFQASHNVDVAKLNAEIVSLGLDIEKLNVELNTYQLKVIELLEQIAILNIPIVTFNIDGAILKYGVTESLIHKPEAPIKEGSLFVGWFSDIEKTILFDFTSIVEEDITLYAKFEIIEIDEEKAKKNKFIKDITELLQKFLDTENPDEKEDILKNMRILVMEFERGIPEGDYIDALSKQKHRAVFNWIMTYINK